MAGTTGGLRLSSGVGGLFRLLFNSYIFLFAFLPIALGGFFAVGRWGRRPAGMWLVVASFVFYGWWNPVFCLFLATSIVANFVTSRLIGRLEGRPRWQFRVLLLGVAANLSVLCYFKYLTWLAGLIDGAFHTGWVPGGILLPLGISFFTFTQIGYLVDCAAGVARDRDPLNYALFVTFFPHLIAGPILHNQDIMPQFARPETYRWCSTNVMVGVGIFVVGLLKKTLLADPASVGVAEAFAHPDALPLFAAWQTALSYSLQLYFDFSGYSDMAIGLARMFNVTFPLNFDSPYKARSVIEYWQRWHMTLTRFLTQYIYTPIAIGAMRRRREAKLRIDRTAQRTMSGFSQMIAWPIVATMTLAGIWHGSGAQFLVFGLLHAFYLCVNHLCRVLFGAPNKSPSFRIPRIGLTYLCVLVGSVFFRAPSVGAAMSLLQGMIGLHGASEGLPVSDVVLVGAAGPIFSGLAATGIVRIVTGWADLAQLLQTLAWFVALYSIVWLAPNTQQIFANYAPALGDIEARPGRFPRFSANVPWAIALGFGAALAVLSLGGSSEFLYFQF